jgi:hypothetical protein
MTLIQVKAYVVGAIDMSHKIVTSLPVTDMRHSLLVTVTH